MATLTHLAISIVQYFFDSSQATDQSFLEKCHFHHSGNELYDKPRMSDPEFFIAHYAGKIKYNVRFYYYVQIKPKFTF